MTTSPMVKISRALISVSNKEGIVALAEGLSGLGIEIVSTGGTAQLLKKSGIPVIEISDYTGFPEMLDGRVKTLHPKVHAGLLAVRSNAGHTAALKEHGIPCIDMVVINLYPFGAVSRRQGVSHGEVIENIDIGGPAMIRSASKNHESVAVVTDPRQYDAVLAALRAHKGSLPEGMLFELATDAFRLTSSYDAQIAGYLSSRPENAARAHEGLPETVTVSFEKIQDLRYGENPHQKAAFYAETGARKGLALMKQLQGKELSFNNILDAQAACAIVREFTGPAAVFVKHNNPCGAAQDTSLCKALIAARDCDPLSAFGGIIAVNRALDVKTAEAVAASGFLECVIAPGFNRGALKPLSGKKNLRILEIRDASVPAQLDLKRVNGGLLVQETDSVLLLSGKELKVVTKKKPTKEQMRSLCFAWAVAKHVKSNAIVLARGTATVGIGAGHTSRVDSVLCAIRKAGARARRSCLASDAFFPKPDSIAEAARAGVSCIIQPGGSIADDEIILACNRHNISMVFTGIRHFKH